MVLTSLLISSLLGCSLLIIFLYVFFSWRHNVVRIKRQTIENKTSFAKNINVFAYLEFCFHLSIGLGQDNVML